MRLRGALAAATSWRSLLVGALLVGDSSAKGKKDKPEVKVSKFEHAPVNIQYFDDSDVIIFQDWQTDGVYRSTDAGATWDQIKGPPGNEGWQVTMHPFDSTRAYVLTDGSTHWMTNDRGETWEEFFTDSPPSSFRPAFAFHASDPDRIIFNGVDCSGLFCVEQVRTLSLNPADCE